MARSEKNESQRAAFLMALRTVEEATSLLVSPSAIASAFNVLGGLASVANALGDEGRSLCSAVVELVASPAPDIADTRAHGVNVAEVTAQRFTEDDRQRLGEALWRLHSYLTREYSRQSWAK
jgi:hypothetical protein